MPALAVTTLASGCSERTHYARCAATVILGHGASTLRMRRGQCAESGALHRPRKLPAEVR
jgi:hypothetical protein